MLALLTSALAHDEAIRVLPAPRLLAHRRLAPLRLGLPADRRLALATAVGMVARVHHRAADGRPAAQPPTPTRLTDAQRGVLRVAHLADRGHAGRVHPAHLATRQAHLAPVLVLRHQLSAGA